MILFYPDPNNPMVPSTFKPFLQKAFSSIKNEYPNVSDYLDDVKSIIRNEVEAALNAGANSVQFDSPDNTLTPPTQLQEAIDLNNSVLSRFPEEKLQLHVC